MKVKNRKTGDRGIINYFDNQSIVIYPIDENWNAKGDKKYVYHSLAELNEEWEDYNELEYWYIDSNGDILFSDLDDDKLWKDLAEERKQIGNYFETREEAEKAVEKLKAWKRLKGEIVGWSFSYDLDLNGCGFNDEDIVVGIKLPRNASKKDLDLLFSGEDD